MNNFEMPSLTILTAKETKEASYGPERPDDRGWEGFGNCCYKG